MSVKLGRYIFKKIRGRVVPIRIGAKTPTDFDGVSKSALRKIDAVRNKAIKKKITEFTKDSVVKDKVYHGTNASFKKFSHDKIGSSVGTSQGRGFYFTNKKDIAKGYGKKVNDYYLNIKKPEVGSLNDGFKNFTLREKDIEKMVSGQDLSNWGERSTSSSVAKQIKKYNTNNIDVIQDIGTSVFHNNWKKALARVREVSGIDGSIASNKKVKHYVAYNTDQIMKSPKMSNLYKKIKKIKYRNKK